MKAVNLILMSIFMSLVVQAQGNGFYALSAESLEGKTVKMSEYKSKVVLVVNTASKCGLTPQYEGLEALYKIYKDKGFVVLGFPCNQFGNQDPGTDEEIQSFCQVNYGVTFPMFSKIDVNGKNAHPIYKYLKNSLSGAITDDIKWNFTKFLIDKSGKPIKRYGSNVKPVDLEFDIEETLKTKN